MHLVAVEKMINLYAVTGLVHYAKSSRLYLQIMLELPKDHPGSSQNKVFILLVEAVNTTLGYGVTLLLSK